jgi:hypothetical protein
MEIQQEYRNPQGVKTIHIFAVVDGKRGEKSYCGRSFGSLSYLITDPKPENICKHCKEKIE